VAAVAAASHREEINMAGLSINEDEMRPIVVKAIMDGLSANKLYADRR
jgi:hypothetical protein